MSFEFREKCHNHLKESLNKHEIIEVAWLGGSKATGKEDVYSDTDLMIVLKQNVPIKDAFLTIEMEISKEYQIIGIWDNGYNSAIRFHQKFYLVEGAPETYYIDVALFNEKDESYYLEFLNKDRHGVPEILFDKIGLFDRLKQKQELKNYSFEINDSFKTQVEVMYRTLLKEVLRKKYLDSFAFYMRFVSLYVTVLRNKYTKARFDYGLRYLKEDLPNNEYEKLVFYYQINSLEDIQSKMDKVHVEIQKRYRDVA